MESKKLIVLDKCRSLEPEIFKQNNLIECSFEELKNWTEIEHDLFNEIIAIFQYKEDSLFDEEFKNKIFVKRASLERNIKIKRKSNQYILTILKKMRDTSFMIKNIYQENGYKTTAIISFFNSIYLHEKDGKHSYFEIEYTSLFASLCNKQYSLKYGNYSKLNLLSTINLKGKYAKALYEMLQANKYKKTFTLKETELKSYLKYNLKEYRFSYLVREINKVSNSVNELITFRYIVHKKEKSISFKII